MKTLPFCGAVLLAFTVNSVALTNKVLIIGIDGTMNSALAVANTPNLNTLKSNGCYSTRVVSHPVTHSAAAWTSIFTGVWGDKTGVNDPNNSFTGNHLAEYPSFFTRVEAANSNWNTLAFARWAPITNAVPGADEKRAFGSDADITAETCRRLTNSNPDVFWMLLLDVDSAGHNSGWGPTVSNYVRAIEIADGRVGQIINALTNRPTYTNEDWLVIVQSDHGKHDDLDPEISQIVWSIFAGASTARGVLWPAPSSVDTCATVLTHMGVPINPAWNLDARPAGFPLPPTRFGTNLIFNGNAEASSGTNNYTTNRCITWWFDIASTSLGVYGSNPNFPPHASPGPTNHGANFFLGGTTNGTIRQRINITDIAADTDEASVAYELSGWFGGAGNQEDWASLTADFLDAAGTIIGSNTVGHVTAAERNGITGLFLRSTNGTVPMGTRFVEFTLTHRVVTGPNDSSADNLSFVLTAPPFAMSGCGETTNGWQVMFASRTNFHYALERSEDLQQWMQVTPFTPGTGGGQTLEDTNALGGQVFYRIARLQP